MVAYSETFYEKVNRASDNGDYAQVLELLAEPLAKRSAPFSYDERYYLFYLKEAGYAALQCKEWERASRYLEEALEVARRAKSVDHAIDLAWVLHMLGDANIELEHPQAALAYLKESVYWLEETSDFDQAMHLWQDIGKLSERCGRLEDAQKYLHLCLACAREKENIEQEIRTLQALVSLALKQDAKEAAIGYFDDVLHLLKNTKADRLNVSAYAAIGAMAMTLERYETAHDYYRTALSVSSPNHDLRHIAHLHLRLAVSLSEMSRFDEAERNIRCAREIYEERNDVQGQGHCFWHLGAIAHRQQDWKAMHSYFLKSTKCYAKVNDRKNCLQALLRVGIAIYELRQFSNAAHLFGGFEALTRSSDVVWPTDSWEATTLAYYRKRLKLLFFIAWFAGKKRTLSQLIDLAGKATR